MEGALSLLARPKGLAVTMLAAGSFLLASCGGGSGTSSPTPLSAPTPTFQPGAYYLDVSAGSKSFDVPGKDTTFNSYVCLCVGTCPTSMRVPVEVERTGSGFTVRAVHGTLVVSLSVNGIAVGGTINGAARNAEGGTSGLSAQREAALSGTITSDHTMGGTIDGGLTLNGPGGSGGCSPADWVLSTR